MGSDTRQQMIRTAVGLFQREGYLATSWRRLVDEAGTPWGSIAHHFPGGKEELGVAAVQMGADAVTGLIDDCFSRHSDDPAAAVVDWFDVSRQLLVASGYSAGCPIALVALELSGSSGAVHEATVRAIDRWERTIAGHLRRAGCARGAAADAAGAVLALFEGALLLARVQRSDRPMRRAAAHAERIVRDARA